MNTPVLGSPVALCDRFEDAADEDCDASRQSRHCFGVHPGYLSRTDCGNVNVLPHVRQVKSGMAQR